ncbi:MAG: hypothetical protein ABI560_18340, partial [Myxococcales bacterium]
MAPATAAALAAMALPPVVPAATPARPVAVVDKAPTEGPTRARVAQAVASLVGAAGPLERAGPVETGQRQPSIPVRLRG